MNVKSFIGREINFDCQPYNTGRGRIVAISEPKDGMWDTYYAIDVEVIEGKTRNRILQHVSYTPMRQGERLHMYNYTARELEQAVNGRTLIYVYPV